ncbi:hypothetical protein GAO09_26135 [Rhizobiales bacterium RZME27]|uniref:Uncharacterized protein n=1 Tax=Endobacterium cereale TaxID=2663029 RepID=A0A6A8AFH2_9HYPH|nr:hypothetical protein [Endobacterium cereale]MQY49519.1 hypothetical protein [Endobacterium cereale]
MSVPKFGFSAYLKLINANPRPQRRLIRERYQPSSGGYDFHRSLRQRIQRIAFEGLSREASLASTQLITKPSERESARRAIERFFTWREQNPGDLEPSGHLLFVSPRGYFKIDFTANFILEIGGRRTAVHIWNTRHTLAGNLARAALATVAARHPAENRPDDFAVLSLQDGSFYRWSDADRSTAALGERLLQIIDLDFAAARTELGLPASPDDDAPAAYR